MDNLDDVLIKLLQLTSQVTEKVDSLDKRMNKIESVVTNDIRQDQRLEDIETSLKEGDERFTAIENRLDVLEKSIIKTICNYLLTAGLTFIVTCIGFYIMNKK